MENEIKNITIESHFVVAYNHNTKTFRIDEDTTWAKFDDGQTHVEGEGWIQPSSGEKLDLEISEGQEKLQKILHSLL